MESGTYCVLGKCSTNWTTSSALKQSPLASVSRRSRALWMLWLWRAFYHSQGIQASLEEYRTLFPLWLDHQNWVRELERTKQWPSGPGPVAMWLWFISRISKQREHHGLCISQGWVNSSTGTPGAVLNTACPDSQWRMRMLILVVNLA